MTLEEEHFAGEGKMNVGPLQKHELLLIRQFLKDYSERLGTEICNDFELEDTPEHREMLELANKWNSSDPKDWHEYSTGKPLRTYDCSRLFEPPYRRGI